MYVNKHTVTSRFEKSKVIEMNYSLLGIRIWGVNFFHMNITSPGS